MNRFPTVKKPKNAARSHAINGPPPSSKSASRTNQRKFVDQNNNSSVIQLSPSCSKLSTAYIQSMNPALAAAKANMTQEYKELQQEYLQLQTRLNKSTRRTRYWDPDDKEFGAGKPIKVPSMKKVQLRSPNDPAKETTSFGRMSTNSKVASICSGFGSTSKVLPFQDSAAGWTKATTTFKKASSAQVNEPKSSQRISSSKLSYNEDYKEIRSELMNLVHKECKKVKSKVAPPPPSKSMHSFLKTPLSGNFNKNDINLFQETRETRELVSNKLDEMSMQFRENLRTFNKTDPKEVIKTPILSKLSNKSLSCLEKDVSPKIFTFGSRFFQSDEEDDEEREAYQEEESETNEEESEAYVEESPRRYERPVVKSIGPTGSKGWPYSKSLKATGMTKSQEIQTQADLGTISSNLPAAPARLNQLKQMAAEIKFKKDMSTEDQRLLEELRKKKEEWDKYTSEA